MSEEIPKCEKPVLVMAHPRKWIVPMVDGQFLVNRENNIDPWTATRERADDDGLNLYFNSRGTALVFIDVYNNWWHNNGTDKNFVCQEVMEFE